MTNQINSNKLFVVDRHPAIPPSDLLKKWEDKWFDEEEHPDVLLIQAFQAGADQELEACCEWLKADPELVDEIRATRRPKPPSLKEQALEALAHILNNSSTQLGADTIRRALDQLND
jgi:hypothetical protein